MGKSHAILMITRGSTVSGNLQINGLVRENLDQKPEYQSSSHGIQGFPVKFPSNQPPINQPYGLMAEIPAI